MHWEHGLKRLGHRNMSLSNNRAGYFSYGKRTYFLLIFLLLFLLVFRRDCRQDWRGFCSFIRFLGRVLRCNWSWRLFLVCHRRRVLLLLELEKNFVTIANSPARYYFKSWQDQTTDTQLKLHVTRLLSCKPISGRAPT